MARNIRSHGVDPRGGISQIRGRSVTVTREICRKPLDTSAVPGGVIYTFRNQKPVELLDNRDPHIFAEPGRMAKKDRRRHLARLGRLSPEEAAEEAVRLLHHHVLAQQKQVPC